MTTAIGAIAPVIKREGADLDPDVLAKLVHLRVERSAGLAGRATLRFVDNGYTLSAGDVFMPAAALYSEPYLISARALSASRLLMIDSQVVRQEARTCTELALALARVLAGQWRVALKIILDLKLRSPSQRLAAFLLRLHDGAQAGPPAEIPFSKRQLASRIGMQPETLSRTLQTLAANGLHLRGRQIIITNRAAAEEFCGPDPYPPASEYELGVHAL